MGTTVSCKFNSSDDVYLVSNTTEAEIDRFSSTISYVQETDEPVDIRISSRNENGRSSPIFVLGVLLCTNCSGHGVCKDVKRKDPRENVYFRYAACECEPQYEGGLSASKSKLPSWGLGYPRTFISNAYGQSHSYASPCHIPSTKPNRPKKDTDTSLY